MATASWTYFSSPAPSPPSEPETNGIEDSISDSTRLMYQQLATENMIKFGDEIRLIARSSYTKKPKPAWLDPTGQGWTAKELMPGALGVYEKLDGSRRILVPPKGDQAGGTFRESYYRIEDVYSGVESHGRPVNYGDTVVLVDENGLVWNNKTGGLFYDGYLTPAPKNAPGEVYVSFRKTGKERYPMEYGDVGVFVDVVDSHRHRGAFNNRLTCYKSAASNVVGGYVCCDGSGDPLPLIVQRYQGRIKPRQSAFGGSSSDHMKKPSLSRGVSIKGMAPELKLISVVTNGVRDVMRVAPNYGVETILYNLSPESQVEFEIEDGSTAVVDCSSLLIEGHGESVVIAHGRGAARGVQLALKWSETSPLSSSVAVVADPKRVVRDLVLALLLLLALYLGLLAFMYAGLGWEHKNRRSALSLFVCWLAGLVSPPCARGGELRPPERRGGRDVVLVVRFLPLAEEEEQEEEAARMQEEKLAKEEKYVGKYDAPGMDEQGMPLHPAFVRFLNGEQGNMAEALRRWQTTCEWRAENGVDAILQSPRRLFFLIKAFYPAFYIGRTRYGHPVYLERIGSVKMNELRRGGAKLRDMIEHYVFMAEFQWTILEPAEYARSLTILDVAGIGIFDFAGEAVEFIKKASAVAQEHYPERGFMVFVINAPYWFTSVWAVVKQWVNPRTLSKIRILGKEYHSELFKFVDPAALPVEYGGTGSVSFSETAEEKLLRNTVVRVLLEKNVPAIGPGGEIIPREELERQIDPSVDHLAGKSLMTKIGVDGELLCDANGRPVVKKF